MRSLQSLSLWLAAISTAGVARAATADQWRTRSIYQLITDRFAPPSGTAPARTSPLPQDCDAGLQTWCGGTWLSIIDKLDYIQNMGFDAVWISPTSQNLDVWTPYNYAYHGYWVTDPRQINLRFGSADDLKALSKAIHDRGMYLMVDVVVNNVPGLRVGDALSADTLKSEGLIWDDPSYFHKQCWIDYNNQTSVENCWLGDSNLPLMDVDTENAHVIETLQTWIKEYVNEFSIDGLRIDAAKHVPGVFWQGFCGAGGVFCMGEVYGDDLGYAAQYQTKKWMDSILGFPYYYGLVKGFGQPMGNMSGYVDTFNKVLSAFPDPGLLGNFIENHDLPRWRNTTADPQLGWNAMVAQFIFNGIPTVYYGQEQDTALGANDPYNRGALWPSKYANTTTYNRIARLNAIRTAVITNGTVFNGTNFMQATSHITASTANDVAIRRGPLLAVLTNRGSPPQNASFGVASTGWPSQSSVIDVLSCRSFTVGTGGTISVSYSASGYGGMPYMFMSSQDVNNLRLCDYTGIAQTTNSTVTATIKSAGSPRIPSSTSSYFGGLIGVVFLSTATIFAAIATI